MTLGRIACGLILLITCSAAWGQSSTPNIVLIISDDHGWTDYSFMKHPHIGTPSLDRLASQSVVYSRGYVPSSLCCPSLATIITGLYPHQHKITSNDPPKPETMNLGEHAKTEQFRQGREVMNRHLEAVPTLPRMLAERGYVSFQSGKWWQGDYRRGGFTDGMTKGQRHGDEGLGIGRQTMQPIYDFVADARRKDKPFFLWYAPMLPHQPHNPPQRLLAKYKDKTASSHEAKYFAMVEWFDETCGRLLDYLDEQKLAENTVVIYVADNGWVQAKDAATFVRSKRSPYDAGLRTPIMVRWPGRARPAISSSLAMSIDIAPTVLAAAGVKPTVDMQGINLLDQRAVAQRKLIFGECFTHNSVDLNDPAKSLEWRWAIEGRWKLIVPAGPSPRVELYDILADPREQKDVAGDNRQTVEALRAKLDGWWKPG